MIIFVLVKPDNKKLSIKVEPTDTILDLKKKLQLQDERFRDNLMFVFDQINLSDDNKTLQDCHIEKYSVIYFYYCEYRPIYLNIQSFQNKSYHLYFDPSNIFHDIRKYLENKYGVPKNQTLVLCNEILDDFIKLEKIKHEHFSHPMFVCPQLNDDQKQKPIIIKLLNGGYYLIQFNFSEKVSTLKKLIQQKLQLSNKIRIYSKELLLEDEKTLQDYSLPNYPLLFVSPHIGGDNSNICIKYSTGEELQMKVESKDTIKNIKLLLNYIDHQPLAKQNLKFNDHDLNDDQKTLESLSIGNGSRININI